MQSVHDNLRGVASQRALDEDLAELSSGKYRSSEG